VTEPYRWKNCYADVGSSGHGRMAKAFLRDVVEPALATLDSQIEGWKKSDEPAAPFILSDVEDLLRTTTLAFCLSIQSLWERQIRSYLQGCARDLKFDPGIGKRILIARWDEFDDLFKSLRGIGLSAFREYAALNSLQLLGNACRHGDGPSLQALVKLHPELWPDLGKPLDPPPPEIFGPTPVFPPTIEGMTISLEWLRTLVDAITSFWDETEYIYNESIERKLPSLEAQLVKVRRERAARGAPDYLTASKA
jgi:hypothetical protein